MKKIYLFSAALLTSVIVFAKDNQNELSNSYVLAKKANICYFSSLNQKKPFLQFVGAVTDPNNSSITYDLYGSNGSVTSVIVFINGVQQTGNGATVSGTYRQGSSPTLFIVNVTITRSNNTSFNYSGTLDIS